MIYTNPIFSGSINVSGSLNLNGQPLTISLVPIYEDTTPKVLNSTSSIQTLTVTGQNFDGTAIGYVKGNNGTRYDPTTSIRNSDVQLTLNFSGSDRLTSANEPYDIYILNGNGENTFEENVVNVDASPIWQTPAGKIGEVYIGSSLTASFNISATDPDSNDTVSYFITGGALPTGMTFITSSGEISQSGEIVEQVSDTFSTSGVNYNTTFAATDNTSNVLRTFYITKKWPDGSSAELAVPSGYYLAQNFPSLSSGTYWIKSTSMPNPLQMYVDMTEEGGGYDFYPIQNGTSVWTTIANGGGSSSPANDGVALGLDMVYPRSKNHWRAATNYVRNVLGETGQNYHRYFKTVGPITRTVTATPPTNDGVSHESYAMRDPNYYGTGAPDWSVPDGGRWWLRDTTFGEPNGDYHAYGFLAISADRVTWNTGNLDSVGATAYQFAEPYDLADLQFNDIGSGRHHSTGGYYLVSTNAKP